MDRSTKAAYENARHHLIAYHDSEKQFMKALRDHALAFSKHKVSKAEGTTEYWKEVAEAANQFLKEFFE